MATPFPFQAAAVLTAAQLNAVTTLPVSTKTASYTLTVADLGTRVVMNSASATTITVNTSIFGASDKVEILNIGAGVCTVTAGTCTVGTTGTLALVQNAGGTLTFISASASVFTASGVTATPGAFTCVKAQTTQTGATRVEIDNPFSATYRNYLILIETSNCNSTLFIQMNASGTPVTTSTYNFQFIQANGTVLSAGRTSSTTSAQIAANGSTRGYVVLNMFAPFIAQPTAYRADTYYDPIDLTLPTIQNRIGNQTGSTSFTGFDIISSDTFDTITTCYGYGITL